MARAASLLLIGAIFGCSSPAAASGDLCEKIHTLETTRSDTLDNPKERRWIEYHWNNDHSGDAYSSWGCRHSNQRIAKTTCDWLMNHTSHEFTMALPLGIMQCYGYRMPMFPQYDWSEISGTVILHGTRGRKLILDMKYRDLPGGEMAMRLAVENADTDYEPETLPPIVPFPPGSPATPPSASH